MLFYNCSVFIYSTAAGLKCEINIIVTVVVTVIVIVVNPLMACYSSLSYVMSVCLIVLCRALQDYKQCVSPVVSMCPVGVQTIFAVSTEWDKNIHLATYTCDTAIDGSSTNHLITAKTTHMHAECCLFLHCTLQSLSRQ